MSCDDNEEIIFEIVDFEDLFMRIYEHILFIEGYRFINDDSHPRITNDPIEIGSFVQLPAVIKKPRRQVPAQAVVLEDLGDRYNVAQIAPLADDEEVREWLYGQDDVILSSREHVVQGWNTFSVNKKDCRAILLEKLNVSELEQVKRAINRPHVNPKVGSLVHRYKTSEIEVGKWSQRI